MNLNTIDPLIFKIIESEKQRQQETINLIASENYVSSAVMEATASVLTNKYAEGYVGKRYYPGCTFIDEAEQLAIDRCKKLFDAAHANVQPHSGSQANMGVYFSVLKPGDTILGMSLSSGGHLTHGHGVNFSGTLFNSVQYTVSPETEMLDYDEIERLAEQHKPKMIISGASAYSRIIDFDRLAAIAHSVGAFLLADIAHIAGLVATGLHPNPICSADFVTSTTHKTLRGPRGGLIMSSAEHAAKIDRSIMPGMQGGPLMNIIAAKAVAFHEALQPSFATYQKQIIVNARAMADEFMALNYRIVAGGTDNHLFIVDLRSKNITGLKAEIALEKAGITVTRSCIPFDTEKPWVTSGIRIGTPAITTRKMHAETTREIVHLIDDVINHHDNDTILNAIKVKVHNICSAFPIKFFLLLIIFSLPIFGMEQPLTVAKNETELMLPGNDLAWQLILISHTTPADFTHQSICSIAWSCKKFREYMLIRAPQMKKHLSTGDGSNHGWVLSSLHQLWHKYGSALHSISYDQRCVRTTFTYTALGESQKTISLSDWIPAEITQSIKPFINAEGLYSFYLIHRDSIPRTLDSKFPVVQWNSAGLQQTCDTYLKPYSSDPRLFQANRPLLQANTGESNKKIIKPLFYTKR